MFHPVIPERLTIRPALDVPIRLGVLLHNPHQRLQPQLVVLARLAHGRFHPGRDEGEVLLLVFHLVCGHGLGIAHELLRQERIVRSHRPVDRPGLVDLAGLIHRHHRLHELQLLLERFPVEIGHIERDPDIELPLDLVPAHRERHPHPARDPFHRGLGEILLRELHGLGRHVLHLA